jgi:hypothetical protein
MFGLHYHDLILIGLIALVLFGQRLPPVGRAICSLDEMLARMDRTSRILVVILGFVLSAIFVGYVLAKT